MKKALLLLCAMGAFATACRHPRNLGGSGGGEPVQVDGLHYQDPGEVAKTRNAFQSFHY